MSINTGFSAVEDNLGMQFFFVKPVFYGRISVSRLNKSFNSNKLFRDSMPVFEEKIPVLRFRDQIKNIYFIEFSYNNVFDHIIVFEGKLKYDDIKKIIPQDEFSKIREGWFEKGKCLNLYKNDEIKKVVYRIPGTEFIIYGARKWVKYSVKASMKPIRYSFPCSELGDINSKSVAFLCFSNRTPQLERLPEGVFRNIVKKSLDGGIILGSKGIILKINYAEEETLDEFIRLSKKLTGGIFGHASKISDEILVRGRHFNPNIHYKALLLRLFGEITSLTEYEKDENSLMMFTRFQKSFIDWIVEKLVPGYNSEEKELWNTQETMMSKTVKLECENNLKHLNGAILLYTMDADKKTDFSKTSADFLYNRGYLVKEMICPAGGDYSFVSIGNNVYVPKCSIHGKIEKK